MKINKLLTLSILSVVLLGMGNANADDKKIPVIITNTHVENHPINIGFSAFKEYIEKNTDGRYDVQILPNSSTGPNEKGIKLLRDNKIQFMGVCSAYLEEYDKIYTFFSIPYLFKSEESYKEFIKDPKVIEKLSVNVQKDGFRPVVSFNCGARNFYSKYPIRSVEDLKGRTIRIQSGTINDEMMEAFGAKGYFMNFPEVYSALVRGIIDGAENNEIVLIDQKHGEICKYYTYDGHQMMPELVIASEKFMNSLDEADLKIFTDAAKHAQEVEFSAWEKRIDRAKELGKYIGVQFIDVDVDSFKEKMLPLHKKILEKNPYLKDIYEMAIKYNESITEK